jgi:hypothetical protein
MRNKNKPLSRKDDLVVQDLNGEILIYDLREHKAFCLNETSALVWQACDGNKTAAEISAAVEKKLDSAVSEDLIWLALDQLKKENLVEIADEAAGKFAGMSRREVIRKIGLGSMIALPVVASLVAPTAAQAQTCILGGTCTCELPNGGQGNVCTATASTCNPGCVCRYANSGNSNGVCGP